MNQMKICRKCGSHDFGTWTSASRGTVHHYCRSCRRKRATEYTTRKLRNGGAHTRLEWLKKLDEYDRCPRCNRPWRTIPRRPDKRYRYVWTKDHIRPLTQGGTDDISNIQPLCYQCNSSKCDGRQK
ncbi:MAG: HNH endonuclease [Verrucomicrobia bacterium]|nr:HNH endonuclease [Verrucomicrobiota bacterium]MBU4290034.1 HNH endonuclease [Verrucomicrobiota bacterium]MBU4428073.1 HNH endonuclease [Verrucomicrobiota bacterium]